MPVASETMERSNRLLLSLVACTVLIAGCAGTPPPGQRDDSSDAGTSAEESSRPDGPLGELEFLRPSSELTPEQVVETQLRALQHNGEANRGILIAFRFASPENRDRTGPVERFARMLRNPLYSPMLGSAGFAIEGVQRRDGLAQVVATVTQDEGERTTYIFVLSRQEEGQHKGSWMTDAVQPVQRTEEEQFRSI